MAHREWNNLPGNTQYTIAAKNGWTMSLNADGTVTLKHGNGNVASDGTSTSLTISPDPGAGDPVPPSK